MKKLNNKGFTLVELLAVIVVLAIVMGLAVVAITGVLDNARKATFVADAKSFLEGAHSLVNADDMNSMLNGEDSSKYKPICNANVNVVYIPIGAVKLQQGGEKSPYGNVYLGKKTGDTVVPVKTTAPAGVSYIKVESSKAGAEGCTYTFGIFLSDGVYKIDSITDNVSENNITTANVKTVSSN